MGGCWSCLRHLAKNTNFYNGLEVKFRYVRYCNERSENKTADFTQLYACLGEIILFIMSDYIKPSDDLNFARHLLVSVLTLIFCVVSVVIVAPIFIEKKSVAVLQPYLAQTQKVAKLESELDTEIPSGLFDYLNATRNVDMSQSDMLGKDELIDAFEKFQEDYTQKASDFLADRFANPGLENFGDAKEIFATPEGLKEEVAFWKHIFGHYTKDHVIFYDPNDVSLVYSVLDFSETQELDDKSLASLKTQMVSEEKARLNKLIQKIAPLAQAVKDPAKVTVAETANFTREEKRLFFLMLKVRENIDIDGESLVSNITLRNGFSHRIRQAVVASGQYMDEMRRIFRERGLPEELTVIPFVESAFNIKAYSSAGAAGIWQFIEATGSRYLRIDEYVDERYDPILGAYAAATHLANEYKLLKSWPLTINAYNTGPGRMLQATRELNTTDIATIIEKFDGAGYGFDSRNYFPEFLAALEVINNKEEYFGDITPLPAQSFEYVMMPASMNIRELAKEAGVSTSVLIDYNPTFSDAVALGSVELPKGYLLKIPADTKDDVLFAMQDLYRDAHTATHYVVKKGATPEEIAGEFDVPLDRLLSANRLIPGQKLKKGDILQLPQETGDDAFARESVLPDDVTKPVF